MKPILLFLLLSPILAQAQTRVTTNELSTTTAYNFPATAPVTISSLTTKGDTLFDSETSTASFHGWVDIGFEIISPSCSSSVTNAVATCSAGKRVIGTGCETNGTMQAVFANTTTTVICYVVSAAAVCPKAYCARIK